MLRLFPVILLASACGGTETSELTFPGDKLTEFILRIDHGAVVVRNPTGNENPKTCLMRVTELGVAKALGAKERFNPSVTAERIRLRQRRDEPELRLELLVILPKGVNIDVAVNDGGVRLEGTFGLTGVTCRNGDVVADPLKAAGGSLKTLIGNVRLVLMEPRIESEFTCEAIEGDVSLRIPIAFRGPVQLASGSASIDYGEAPKMLLAFDSERKSARGFAGEKMTDDELKEANSSGRWPPGIWGKTAKGRLTFRQDAPASPDGG